MGRLFCFMVVQMDDMVKFYKWRIKEYKQRQQELREKGIDDADLQEIINLYEDELEAYSKSLDCASEDTQKSL